MTVGRKKGEPETYFCRRCNCEVFDRQSKGFTPLWYCGKCKLEVQKEKNHNKYRKLHPKPTWKYEKILSRLKTRPATEPELLRLTKIKNKVALKTTITQLREKGHNIQVVHFIPCHYILVKTK